jgi:hypothetical protein
VLFSWPEIFNRLTFIAIGGIRQVSGIEQPDPYYQDQQCNASCNNDFGLPGGQAYADDAKQEDLQYGKGLVPMVVPYCIFWMKWVYARAGAEHLHQLKCQPASGEQDPSL